MPWKDTLAQAYKRKMLRYTELAAAEAETWGWKARLVPRGGWMPRVLQQSQPKHYGTN